jgi:MarR family transcriptional regulator for hemolysin
MTIAVVAAAPLPLSQSDLADRLGVEAATMVTMLDRLTKAGLAVRQTSKSDRRVKRVILTETGRRLYGSVKAVADGVRKELLSHADPSDLAVATNLLETLHEVIAGLS